MLFYLNELDLTIKNLKKFGITMAIALSIFALILFLKHKDIFKIIVLFSFLFMSFALCRPSLLRRVYQIWMGFAFCLGWVNTRIILFIIFYIVITPIGLLMRLFGKDFLDLKWDEAKEESCWIKQPNANFSKENYERTF